MVTQDRDQHVISVAGFRLRFASAKIPVCHRKPFTKGNSQASPSQAGKSAHVQLFFRSSIWLAWIPFYSSIETNSFSHFFRKRGYSDQLLCPHLGKPRALQHRLWVHEHQVKTNAVMRKRKPHLNHQHAKTPLRVRQFPNR